jgi:hypothetical protein
MAAVSNSMADTVCNAAAAAVAAVVWRCVTDQISRWRKIDCECIRVAADRFEQCSDGAGTALVARCTHSTITHSLCCQKSEAAAASADTNTNKEKEKAVSAKSIVVCTHTVHL